MLIVRSIFISVAIAITAVATASASSEGVAKGEPEPISLSGIRWQRVSDPRNPAAPPRLIPLDGSATPYGSQGAARRAVVCVRAGEQLLLHETGAELSTVSLAATALESGACGDRVRARIAVTGALTEIIVLGRGAGVLDGKEDKWR